MVGRAAGALDMRRSMWMGRAGRRGPRHRLWLWLQRLASVDRGLQREFEPVEGRQRWHHAELPQLTLKPSVG